MTRAKSHPAKPRQGIERKQKCLLVLGMHRAGTSALARVFSLCGAELPAHLMPANRGNESGYWEPRQVVELNDRILGYFGLAWDDPFAMEQLPGVSAFPKSFSTEARSIVESEYLGADIFVLKDPRCTLLHAFWTNVLTSLDIDVAPIVVMRPPDEVLGSLMRRDGISAEGAALLYVAHGLEAAWVSQSTNAVVTTYAQLMDDWRSLVARVAVHHGFDWPRLGAQTKVQVEAFLIPPGEPRKIRLPPRLRSWVDEVWLWFVDASEGRPRPAAELQAVRDSLRDAAELFSPLIADRKIAMDKVQSSLLELKSQVQQTGALFTEANQTLETAVSQREKALIERDEALRIYRETDERLQRTTDAYDAADRERARVSEQLNELARESSERESSLLAERDRALLSYREADAHVQEVSSTFEEQVARLNEQIREHERVRLEREVALVAERDQALRTVDETNARVQEVSSTFEEQVARLNEQILEHERVRLEREVALVAERDQALRTAGETDARLREVTTRYRSLEDESGRLHEQMAELAQAHSLELGSRQQTIEQMSSSLDAANQRLHDGDVDRQSISDELSVFRERFATQGQWLEQTVAERDEVLRVYRDTDEQLQRANREYRRLELVVASMGTALEVERERHGQARRELAELHASSSWRLMAPLRSVVQLGRKALRVGAPHRLLLSGPRPAHIGSNAPPPPLPAPLIEVRAEPEDHPLPLPLAVSREHAGLSRFLLEEFDTDTVIDVTGRIDRYRLPIPSDGVRSAVNADCSEEQADAWAASIARFAETVSGLDAEPEVSIVLPVYNQIPFTLACIEALLAHQTKYSFEILVGDDCSTDATRSVLKRPIKGVRHVRHASNLGFVRNCNETARHARGRYVVFLNNDTQVLPRWLDEMVSCLARNPEVGMVGSKLIYPDGRLQECGGIVWRDGSAWNYGRLEDPRSPEFCYLRDVDYVSGASIALSKDLWQELGGFDELFVPAYAEDVDLAFRVRARGLRTVVQPLSQLLHFEGISSGTDLGQGAKAYQVENLKKLWERWKEVLQFHRANADQPMLEKERGVGKRMLFIDRCTPTPSEDAGSVVAFEMMNAFRESGFKVTFIPEDNFAHMGAETRDLQRLGIETIYHPSYSSMDAFLAKRSDPFDAILLLRYGVAEAHLPALKEKYPSAKIIFSNCDLHYLREMREAEISGDAAALSMANDTKRRELDVVRRSDISLVHSDAELEILRHELPDSASMLFPLVHDPIDYCPPLQERDGVCFVGGYRHAPNADGITWFVERVWPLVLERTREHKLYIAGSAMTDQVKALSSHDNVEVVGFVDDLEGFLAKRRVTIAPLRFGAGAKGKVAVSLANGVPVVSTPVGAEGMQLIPGEDLLVAEDEAGFAECVLDLLVNDAHCRSLSAAALRYAERVTSRSSARRRVAEMLDVLGLAGRSTRA